MRTSTIAKSATDSESVSEVLFRASQMLRATVSDLGDLEDLVGDLLIGATKPSDRTVTNLQRLDLIRQEIRDAAKFIQSIGENCEPHWHVDPHYASRSLKLSDFAARLTGTCDDPPAHGTDSTNDYHLFGEND